MDPLVQLEPEKCLLVLGPQVAAECVSSHATRVPALSYNLLLEAGVQKMLDLEDGLSNEEKIRKRALLVNAYELDPAFVGNVVVNSLKKSNSYSQWLEESFSTLNNLSHSSNQFVEKLQTLQRMGMLLAYTYYDEVLDRTLGTEPILMDSVTDVQSWANHQTRGILHVHGVHSKPETLCCDCVNYDQILGASRSGRILKELCKNKTVIFAGFDGEFFDPFMPKFSSAFVDTMANRQPPLLLSCMEKITNSVSFLMLKIPKMSSLDKTILPISHNRQALPRESQESKRPIITTLHYSDQKSCQEAAEHVKTVSSISVHQLTMRHEISHELELFLDRDGLKGLWSLLFSHSSKLSNGLLGLSLGSNFTVWVKTPPNLRLGMDRSPGHVTSIPPPSLSTNVSLIASMYTPIASPSVSQPASKHLTPSTRPTLPSPLVTTTSRSLLGVSKAGQLLPPELQLNPQSQAKKLSMLRKAKSYYDRTENEGNRNLLSKKNGLLHRESAPEFVYTSEGVFAYQSNRNSGGMPVKPNAATGPSPLLKDGSNIELKIEYVEQKSSKRKKTGKGPDFDNEKQQYIHDAKQWSMDVASRPPLKPNTLQTSSESSVISPEEQERMLQAHFNKIPKSPSPLKPSSSASRLAVSPPPLSTIPSPSRSPKFPSAKPASLQLPSLPPGVNPFLLPQSTGSNVTFPFFSPGMGGEFQHNPTALSQLTGASPLNPYHAMLQLLARQDKKSMFLSDPAVLQGLQGSVPEMFPCLLPTGQIAMIPSSAAVSSSGSEQTETENKKDNKRLRTPEMEREAPKPMPKRRRSSSLPDIYHLSQGLQQESIPEESPQGEAQKPRMFLGGLRPPPPSMIQLHQDAKLSMSEPVIGGFPTPQSSPCPGGFGISQFIGSPSFQHHHPMTPVTPNNETSTDDMKDLVQAGEPQTTPPPHDGSSLPPFPQGRGPIQLWQFLLDLLLSPDKQHMIQWTGNGYEFRIILPEDIAKLWGARKNKPRMNYDKLSRGLRYYYSKGIMDKVPGKKLTFKYTCDVKEFIQKRCTQGRSSSFAVTPLTPMSANTETSVGGPPQTSEATSTGSVFHTAMTSPLFHSSIIDSKYTPTGINTPTKSPTPDSPGHVTSSPGHMTSSSGRVTSSPGHMTSSPGHMMDERSPIQIKTES